ncbi:hypothetical protein [Rhodococcus rhodochrous]|uniref:hypothetical protein n=1 Tax=Rhodococcus rhodochrous TaxID=1829 RepID=UPI001E63D7CE|nr:hypothetical protein [Rhodococcus rhodochrous]MCD2096516.1 hypothetical protein [Rhodococcus rhodochrous]MCD2121266.1 hypothetical protein [Rhodococcus rhodochrous]MCQ4137360.1 hypothetical protein [Rhodococcus rhodochrous]MDJ0021147.1 hypothetical protein [Rhodococcus rhodochrous]
MAYSKFHGSGWKNRPNFSTPITAEAMDHIEEGIAEAHRLAEAGGGGGGSLVEDPPGSGLYSPSSAGLTEDPANPGLYLI